MLPAKLRGTLKSFEGLLFENYPELAIIQDETDFARAFALGAYISQPEQQFLSYSKNSTYGVKIHVDVTKITKFLCEEFAEIPANLPETLGISRMKLVEFVIQILDIKKLQSIVAHISEHSKENYSFLELHSLIIKCAKGQIAVVSIDVAILNWVTILAKDEVIQPHIIKLKMPIVDSTICKSLVSLANYPELYSYIEVAWEEFMLSLEQLKSSQVELYDLYARYVASLMLPLPEGLFKQKLSKVTFDFIEKQTKSYPKASFSDLIMCGSPDRFPVAENLREHGGVKYLMLASIGPVMTFGYDSSCFYLLTQSCYKGTLIAGQIKTVVWQKVERVRTDVTFSSQSSGKGQDVCVISSYRLSEMTLVLLGRYVQGDTLTQREFRDLLFAQAAYGIMMITAPEVTVQAF